MEISNKINESYLNVEEINQTTGEVITLSSTSETSVQTVILPSNSGHATK